MENTTLLKEKVLLLSKKQNKAILPYTVDELNAVLNDVASGYKSLQEVIDGRYTISLDKYKVGFIARFKAVYGFMRKKAASSFIDALDVALEQTFNKYLHPAVIEACKSLDELDIYLDCLHCNELEQFPFFKIEYEL